MQFWCLPIAQQQCMQFWCLSIVQQQQCMQPRCLMSVYECSAAMHASLYVCAFCICDRCFCLAIVAEPAFAILATFFQMSCMRCKLENTTHHSLSAWGPWLCKRCLESLEASDSLSYHAACIVCPDFVISFSLFGMGLACQNQAACDISFVSLFWQGGCYTNTHLGQGIISNCNHACGCNMDARIRGLTKLTCSGLLCNRGIGACKDMDLPWMQLPAFR